MLEHYIDYTLRDLTFTDLVEAICAEIGIDSVRTRNGASSANDASSVSGASTLGMKSAKLLPAPFAWIPIPEGKVTLTNDRYDDKENVFLKKGQSKTVEVPAFAIGKYPVTNAQFRLFVDAGGYKNRQWWTDEGWEAKAKGWTWQDWKWIETHQPWTQPRYWNDGQWNGDNHPIVGVSWYETVAFCRWLSETAGENITLPTEAQWQRAAQGDDGRVYPWGDDWDASRCNNNVDSNGIGKTTPVTEYEGKGDSPFKVVDMAGNVWEWCVTAYYTGQNFINGVDVRVLRGCSWINIHPNYFRCVLRYWSSPHLGSDDGGVRLALS